MAAENYLREGDFASASAMLVELFMLDEKVERSKLSEEAEAFLLEAVEKCELRGISEWVISQTEPL